MAMVRKNGTTTIPFAAMEPAVPDQSPILPRPLRIKIRLSRILPSSVRQDSIPGFMFVLS